ncbi:STM4015 family protein [Actinoplanes rectilineatus]|uniref:STM4015 family protein n=1 Tax=Actinoplanes rectilineatus TaxID=113571 RepID=UPI0005F2B1E3|nr:STM4015 family protein [Actinoplanes rectilineatus]
MDIDDDLETFAGLPVRDVEDDSDGPDDPAAVAWRFSAGYGEADRIPELFAEILERTGPAGPTALIFGNWGGAMEERFPIGLLLDNVDRLPNLRAVFAGDMSSEECEISWIKQVDVTPLLTAFPRLECLWVRGSDGLVLTPVRHENLRELSFQSGGLPVTVVRAVGACDLPALEELDLWLGIAEYGGETTVDDLAPILSGRPFPALTHLGLRNSEIQDQVAAAVASAPVVAKLTVLDLSMGTLGDEGVEALLAGQPLTHLERLDVSHHFVSPELAQRLVDELPGVEVDISDEQDEDDEEFGRYTAVDE